MKKSRLITFAILVITLHHAYAQDEGLEGFWKSQLLFRPGIVDIQGITVGDCFKDKTFISGQTLDGSIGSLEAIAPVVRGNAVTLEFQAMLGEEVIGSFVFRLTYFGAYSIIEEAIVENKIEKTKYSVTDIAEKLSVFNVYLQAIKRDTSEHETGRIGSEAYPPIPESAHIPENEQQEDSMEGSLSAYPGMTNSSEISIFAGPSYTVLLFDDGYQTYSRKGLGFATSLSMPLEKQSSYSEDIIVGLSARFIGFDASDEIYNRYYQFWSLSGEFIMKEITSAATSFFGISAGPLLFVNHLGWLGYGITASAFIGSEISFSEKISIGFQGAAAFKAAYISSYSVFIRGASLYGGITLLYRL